jgi:hypothetical protein
MPYFSTVDWESHWNFVAGIFKSLNFENLTNDKVRLDWDLGSVLDPVKKKSILLNLDY